MNEKFKKFICDSTLENPRTITYRGWAIVSAGEGGNRYIHIYEDGIEVGFMWVDTHYYKACFIHSVKTSIDDIYDWLDQTCSSKNDCHWSYDTWDDVDKLMFKLYDFIRNKS